MAYVSYTEHEHVWADREGNLTSLGLGEPSGRPIISPDGKRVAVMAVPRFRGDEFRVHDLQRGGRIGIPGIGHVQWSRDGSELFTSRRAEGASNATIHRVRSDGSGQPVEIFDSEHNCFVTGISPDNEWLLIYQQNPETSRDVWALGLEGEGQSADAIPLVVTPASERAATFSPDGRWFAYQSNTSGRDDVYVRRFDPGGSTTTEHLVSTEGGREPVWSRDGKELFYRVGRALMAVDVELDSAGAGHGFRAGEPRKLFEGDWAVESGGMNPMYDVAPDGERFVMVRTADEANTIRVALGWLAELGEGR